MPPPLDRFRPLNATVVIPWRGGCPHRERALDWVIAYYERSGYRVVVSDYWDEPWRKARAVMPAVERARPGVVVVADADLWCEDLDKAVWAILCGLAEWAVPHRVVHRLSEQATSRFYDTGLIEYDCKPYEGRLGGGIVVAHRDTLLDVPLDRRYAGWGQEDESWGMALRVLKGDPWRGTAPLHHLWHPPPTTVGHPSREDPDNERWTRRRGSSESWNLYKKYNNARHAGPEAMRKLLEDA